MPYCPTWMMLPCLPGAYAVERLDSMCLPPLCLPRNLGRSGKLPALLWFVNHFRAGTSGRALPGGSVSRNASGVPRREELLNHSPPWRKRRSFSFPKGKFPQPGAAWGFDRIETIKDGIKAGKDGIRAGNDGSRAGSHRESSL